MIPVEVSGISISPPYQGYVVILKEKNGDQWLPIFIGATEAHTISLLLQGLKYVRPLTYDMFNSVINAASAKVEKIEVTDLKENTFYALIYLNTENGLRTIDARPSDAIALALKTKADIYVHEDVFTEAGMRGEVAKSDPGTPSDRLDELKGALANAVEKEDYEEAAKLRDQIKEVEEISKTNINEVIGIDGIDAEELFFKMAKDAEEESDDDIDDDEDSDYPDDEDIDDDNIDSDDDDDDISPA